MLEAWVRRFPRTEVTVACAAPQAILERLLRVPFRLLAGVPDPGMLMSGALDVQVADSHAAYLALHGDWADRLEAESRRLRDLRPDLVLTNISHLAAAAAQVAEVPAAGLCSLNWADIYQAYCGELAGADAVLRQIRAAYAGLRLFIVPTPGMQPAWHPTTATVGPIARLGPSAPPGQLQRRLQLDPATRVVVINGGGMEMRLPVECWPEFERLHWLVPDHWRVVGANFSPYAASGLAFRDMLLAADAVLTKPGYGMFVDAACNALPVLYLRREDWPEEPLLVDWLQRHGRARAIGRDAAVAGAFEKELQSLLDLPALPAPVPSGAYQTVDLLTRLLD